MEVFYITFSVISTILTSLFLSLILAFQLLFTRRRSSSRAALPESIFTCYEGTVSHERRLPIRHSFRNSMRYALIDLDRAVVPPGHLSADEARRKAETTGPVFFLTIPPSVGYEYCPISVYYCYDLEGSSQCLKKCITEVTNQWLERLWFLFNPNSDVVAKALHLSSFMDMLGNWIMKANDPAGGNLFVSIAVQHPTLGDYFTSNLSLRRVPASLVSDPTVFFWFTPHKAILMIYWEAFKLWWKNAPYVRHVKHTNLGYKEEAQIRDIKLQCCPAMQRHSDKHLPLDDISLKTQTNINSRYEWRDSRWSWS